MVRLSRWRARGRWFESRRRHTSSFWIFRLLSVDHSSANIIQMKSSMTFIQGNGWTEIYLILKQIWRRFIRSRSALNVPVYGLLHYDRLVRIKVCRAWSCHKAWAYQLHKPCVFRLRSKIKGYSLKVFKANNNRKYGMAWKVFSQGMHM